GYDDVMTSNSGISDGSYGGEAMIIFLNNGGHLQDTIDYTTPLAPTAIGSGDIDGDGNLDLVVTGSTANAVGVLFGTATGSFGSPVGYPVAGTPTSLVVRDLNNDGLADVATAFSGSGGVVVLANQG